MTDTVAGLLQQQLSTVIQTGRSADRESARGREQPQAEPFSDFYPYQPSMAIINGAWTIPRNVDHGTFVLATDGPQGPPPARFVRGVVAEIRTASSQLLCQADAATLSSFSGVRLNGYWVRAADPIRHVMPDPFLEEFFARFPSAQTAPANRIEGGWMQIWGMVFPEETEWRKNGDGWVFFYIFNPQRSGLVQPVQRVPPQLARKGKKNRKR